MSCDVCSLFPPGSLVVVKQGRYAGSVFVTIGIAGTDNDARILIADGRRIKAGKPKKKNARHIERTGVILGEVTRRLERGKALDDGWLCEVIARGGR
ncbi:MAG: KOW domain-containing RNA-binding protein [Synergistaceae bacterium]|nr:KOW domain-containing RNA-binding protein [Synergistaceae bacterium]